MFISPTFLVTCFWYAFQDKSRKEIAFFSPETSCTLPGPCLVDGRFSQEPGGALSHVPLLSLLASRLGDSDEEVMRESVFLFFVFMSRPHCQLKLSLLGDF